MNINKGKCLIENPCILIRYCSYTVPLAFIVKRDRYFYFEGKYYLNFEKNNIKIGEINYE